MKFRTTPKYTFISWLQIEVRKWHLNMNTTGTPQRRTVQTRLWHYKYTLLLIDRCQGDGHNIVLWQWTWQCEMLSYTSIHNCHLTGCHFSVVFIWGNNLDSKDTYIFDWLNCCVLTDGCLELIRDSLLEPQSEEERCLCKWKDIVLNRE